MRKVTKDSPECLIRDIILDNEGTSLVLVSIIAIMVLICIVILRTTTSSLWATADKQYNQDRAYVAASSLGTAIDELIQSGNNPSNFDNRTHTNGDVTVTVNVTESSDSRGYYYVAIRAVSGDTEYVYTLTYYKQLNKYIREY